MNALKKILYGFFRMLPVSRRKVLVMSYYGANYGCNPKYISQKLVEDGAAKVVWAFNKPERYANIPGIKAVRYLSAGYLYTLATARVIVTNYRMTADFSKRPGQTYIQTWHSSLRLKAIENDALASLKPGYVEMARRDSAQIDILISGCRRSTEIFRRAFWYDGEIMECGTPRNDALAAGGSPSVREKVMATLGVDPAMKYVLYAPTFRESKTTDVYNIDFAALTAALATRFGGRWGVLLRLHPHMAGRSAELCRVPGVTIADATAYDDIQELLASADALVTDYSSLMFDYLFTGRPVWLYASDVAEYTARERNLYFELPELPFPLVSDNAALQQAVLGFDAADYARRRATFEGTIGSFEHGTAAAAIAARIRASL